MTFDPLDGSSIISCNWSVGSIFGIWKNSEEYNYNIIKLIIINRKLIGKTGKDLLGSVVA